MSEEAFTYNEDLGTVEGRENLWRAVLRQVIAEAGGMGIKDETPAGRARAIAEARAYLTEYNRDFNTVCSLAGLDPEAVRDRVKRQLANAQSPEALAVMSRRERERATNEAIA